MRTPNFAERLSMANAAKKAQLKRARRIVDDPERAERKRLVRNLSRLAIVGAPNGTRPDEQHGKR